MSYIEFQRCRLTLQRCPCTRSCPEGYHWPRPRGCRQEARLCRPVRWRRVHVDLLLYDVNDLFCVYPVNADPCTCLEACFEPCRAYLCDRACLPHVMMLTAGPPQNTHCPFETTLRRHALIYLSLFHPSYILPRSQQLAHAGRETSLTRCSRPPMIQAPRAPELPRDTRMADAPLTAPPGVTNAPLHQAAIPTRTAVMTIPTTTR